MQTDSDEGRSPQHPTENFRSEEACAMEVRAAVDVMFEALSHIQASLGADTEEERVQTYHKFKEALYERFELAVEKRQEEFGRPRNADRENADREEGRQKEASPKSRANVNGTPSDQPPMNRTSEGEAVENGTPKNGTAKNGTRGNGTRGNGAAKETSPEKETSPDKDSGDDDTLGKLWPTIAEQAGSSE
jgi:hypothetical protein